MFQSTDLPSGSGDSSSQPLPKAKPIASFVGGVLGAVVGLALVAAIFLLLLRWTRKRKRATEAPGSGQNASAAKVGGGSWDKPELSGGQDTMKGPEAELEGQEDERRSVHELEGDNAAELEGQK